jgi:hypothetical protein
MPQFRRRVGHSWVHMGHLNRYDVDALCESCGIHETTVRQWLATNARDYDALTTYAKTLLRVSEAKNLPVDITLIEQLFND